MSNSVSDAIAHPYFDVLESQIWLSARVEEDAQPSVVFYVSPPVDEIGVRIANCFRRFQLDAIYSACAGREMAEIRGALVETYHADGKDGLLEHLRRQQRSFASVSNNSWRSAMYTALADSEWFLSGGYSKIPTVS